MFRKIKMAISSQKWLRERSPEEKLNLLSYELAEVIDGAMNDGMDVERCWITVTFSSIGITVSSELFLSTTKKSNILAMVNLSEEPLFINAHRLLTSKDAKPQLLAGC